MVDPWLSSRCLQLTHPPKRLPSTLNPAHLHRVRSTHDESGVRLSNCSRAAWVTTFSYSTKTYLSCIMRSLFRSEPALQFGRSQGRRCAPPFSGQNTDISRRDVVMTNTPSTVLRSVPTTSATREPLDHPLFFSHVVAQIGSIFFGSILNCHRLLCARP